MSNDQEQSVNVDISLQFCANPYMLKYVFSIPLAVEGIHKYAELETAPQESPLAARLLEIDNVQEVLITAGFIAVTYREQQHMPKSHEKVIMAIKAHLEEGLPFMSPEVKTSSSSQEEEETAGQIQKIIAEQIRPALQQDGGDIEFVHYKDHTLFVTLQGACSGCPHAMMTLQNGVLNRVQAELPEVQEIIAL